MASNDETLIRPLTPELDPKLSELAHRATKDSDSDDDSLLAELDDMDNDLNMAGYREQRLEQLKNEMERVKSQRENDHGKYTEIFDEKEVIRTSANESRCVIHFYHRNFQRCKIMDKHLEALAPKYFSTRFIRVFVENVPWLVEKLGIKILPCVICFVGGVTKDRIVGFEELGNADDFATSTLEIRLRVSDVIEERKASSSIPTLGKGSVGSKIRSSKQESDDEFDL